jgi:hypothetical protein
VLAAPRQCLAGRASAPTAPSVSAPPAYVSVRQYVSIRQHTSAYVSIRQRTSAYVSIRQRTSAYVSIRQHTSANLLSAKPQHLCPPPTAINDAMRKDTPNKQYIGGGEVTLGGGGEGGLPLWQGHCCRLQAVELCLQRLRCQSLYFGTSKASKLSTCNSSMRATEASTRASSGARAWSSESATSRAAAPPEGAAAASRLE